MIPRFFFIIISLWPVFAPAADQPVIFSRAVINIVSNAPAKETAEAVAGEASKPVIHQFEVEIRPEQAIDMPGTFIQYEFTQTSGLMIVFTSPGFFAISPSNVLSPMDILMIGADGGILQIVPQVTLAQLGQDLAPPAAVKAFLYLKPGISNDLGIKPGDSVDYEIFERSPTIIQQ